MEVINGYDNRDIGVIPQDWKIASVSELVKKGDGIKIGPFGSQLKKELLVERGYKVYGQENVFQKNLEVGNRYLTKNHFIKLQSCELLEGDFIVSMMGTIGKTMIISKSFEKGIMDSHLLRLRLRGDLIDTKFLSHIFESKTLLDQVFKLSVGGIMDGLSSRIVKMILIPLPPLPKQKAIAEVLSDADNLIQSLERQIEKKRMIKQGAMQELLSAKVGWETRQLGEFLQYEQPTKYLVSNTDYSDNFDTPVLTAGKSFILGYSNDNQGIFNNVPVIIFDDFTTATKYVTFPFKAKSSAMKILKPINEDVNRRFIYESIQQIKYPLGDHKRHWIREFQFLEIKVPSNEEQKQIENIISDMEAEIEYLLQKLSKSKSLKIGLMQNLLTGKIRLKRA